MNVKKILVSVVLVIAVIVLIVIVSSPKQPSVQPVGESLDSDKLVTEVQGPGKADEIMFVIAADRGLDLEDVTYYSAFSSSQNQRLLVVWGLAGFDYPHSIAAFDIDPSNSGKLVDSWVGGVQGDLNHQYIGNVRWSDTKEMDVSFDRFVVDEGGIQESTETVSVPWADDNARPRVGG